MLPVSRRLNLKKDFQFVRSGLKLENQNFRIFYKYGENKECRLGISTPSKDFKKAVERNRARRLTSKAVEEIYSELPNNLNLLIFPKSFILNLKSAEASKSLKELIDELFTN